MATTMEENRQQELAPTKPPKILDAPIWTGVRQSFSGLAVRDKVVE
jgi:hypothetical protein